MSDKQNSGGASPTDSPVLEILQQIDEKTKYDAAQKIKILFRGQEYEEWDVETSAFRRLEIESHRRLNIESRKKKITEKDELNYNRGLIRQFKHEDLHSGNSSEIMKLDLGILAQLQHQGAATSLIDFSDNPLIALWFACKESLETKNNNGNLFILSMGDKTKFEEIDSLEKIKNYKVISPDKLETPNEKFLYWKPAHLNNRITAQQSYFLIGKGKVPGIKNILIKGILKNKILEELSSIYGINERTLFPDLAGFAKANSVRSTYGKEEEVIRERMIIRQHDEIIKNNPKDAQAYNERAIAKYNFDDYTGAIEDFTKVISINSKDARAYYNRGFLRCVTKEYKDAIEDFTQAIKFDSKNTIFYNQRGNAKGELANTKSELKKYKDAIIDYKSAIKDFSKTIKIDANNVYAYNNRGYAKCELANVKSELKKYKEAITYYQNAINDCIKSINIERNNAYAYNNRGYAKCGLANVKSKLKKYKDAMDGYQDAINDCTESIKIEPNNTNAYDTRGYTKYKLGNSKRESKKYTNTIDDYQNAIGDTTQAIKIDSTNANAYYNRASAKYQLKDYKEAIDDLTKSININSDYIDAYYNRGNAKFELNDYNGAIDDYQIALKLNKDKEVTKEINIGIKNAKKILKNLQSKSSKNKK